MSNVSNRCGQCGRISPADTAHTCRPPVRPDPLALAEGALRELEQLAAFALPHGYVMQFDAIAALAAALRAAHEENARLLFWLATIPHCPDCQGRGGWGLSDPEGGEMCERCGGTGKAISDAGKACELRAALAGGKGEG